ncbi:sensory neuron membrane protein 1-like isoform X1 [Neodiprion pinetum]|uniref:sensory neuron membrane protein 1-like isoform X1 n=1 Tax=Neodiprion pinetum TaxID=441929 RepID=UPI001EE0FFAB|nr:sensory neuron membrane protein 1-like isoform X1 [Neodiprion pinetum]
MRLPIKLGIGAGVMIFVSVLTWVSFPPFIRSQLRKQVALVEGTDMREFWKKLPFPYVFKVYLFNITNAEGIENGEKPHLQQVGPYVFYEWKEKLNLVDDEEADTVEVNYKNTWYFQPSESNGLTGNEELIYPHLAILSTILVTMIEKPQMISVAAKAVDSIYKKPTSIFMKAKAMDIMFNGIPIDCTVKDFAGSALCAILKSDTRNLHVVGEDMYKFSLFGKHNDTIREGRVKVTRGVKDPKKIGYVVEYKNETIQTVWNGDECNAFEGTDTTVFHPGLYKDENMIVFGIDLCRKMVGRFSKPTKVAGFKTNQYLFDLGDQSTVPEEKCYCLNPDNCLKAGALDLYTCKGTPIIATHPHFYLGDPSYLKNVTGLHPVKEDHEMVVEFEPFTGTPVLSRQRIQLNMFIFPIPKFKLMKNFPYALLPLVWIEENVDLTPDLIKRVMLVFHVLTGVSCFKWILLLGGLALGGAAGGLEFKRRQLEKKLEITPVAPAPGSTDSSKNSADVKKWPVNISTLQPAAVPASIDDRN